jgi:hypothetical protein
MDEFFKYVGGRNTLDAARSGRFTSAVSAVREEGMLCGTAASAGSTRGVTVAAARTAHNARTIRERKHARREVRLEGSIGCNIDASNLRKFGGASV